MKKKDQLTEHIIGFCFKAHNALGPGFNEKVHHNALLIIFGNKSCQLKRVVI